MRSLIITGFVCMLACGQALAATVEIDCAACRSVYEFPADYGNHAFNQVFHTTELSLAEGNKTLVKSPAGHWAMVDLNYVIEVTGFTFMIPIGSYQFFQPTGRISIFVQEPRGKSTEYMGLTGSPPLLAG